MKIRVATWTGWDPVTNTTYTVGPSLLGQLFFKEKKTYIKTICHLLLLILHGVCWIRSTIM